MVKFSIILPILSVSVQSKPQFSDLFDQFGDTFDQFGETFVNIFSGVDISGIINQAEQGFQTVLDAAGGLSESELFQNFNTENLPFNLDEISNINELTTDLVNNALDFSFEDLTSLTTNFESFTQDIDVQQVLENALDTVKGTQVFEDLFSGIEIADLFSDSSSFNFASVSEQAAESLNGLDVSGGYNAFLESVFEIRNEVSSQDQALIVAAIEDSGTPFSSTFSRQVENAFDGNVVSAGAGEGLNLSGVRLGFAILASMVIFGWIMWKKLETW